MAWRQAAPRTAQASACRTLQSSLGVSLVTPLDGAGRAIVQPDLAIAGHPEIFVIGDLACIPGHQPSVPDEKACPLLALRRCPWYE